MKLIPLTQGYSAMVDDEDFAFLNQWKWRSAPMHGKVYAVRTGGKGEKETFYLHHQILGAENVDHRDGDGLNNQRSNLRECTHAQNTKNRKKGRNNKSGFKGVFFCNTYKRWVSSIRLNGKLKHLGYFDCPKEAARTYDTAALKLFGEFAKTNQEMGLL